jgi:predicted MFS family arabinose efflux permease
MSSALAGVVPMAAFCGYAAGLFLLVPLADLVENRRLVVGTLSVAVGAALAAASAGNAALFLLSLFCLGAASTVIQMLMPIAAEMAAPERRGRVIGEVMSGVMVGVLVSRPLATLVTDISGWRAFYVGVAVSLAVVALALACVLPQRRPALTTSYPALIVSLVTLLRGQPVLRRSALFAALGMAAFCAFWTTIAFVLAAEPFSLSAGGIAGFALVGAASALATPFAGRAGDRGWTRPVRIAAHLCLLGSFALAYLFVEIAAELPVAAVLGLAFSAIVLDIAVFGDQTLGRRAINLIVPEARGRVNGIFVGIFFLGGALGSALAGLAWSTSGWAAVCALGGGFAVLALAVNAVARGD